MSISSGSESAEEVTPVIALFSGLTITIQLWQRQREASSLEQCWFFVNELDVNFFPDLRTLIEDVRRDIDAINQTEAESDFLIPGPRRRFQTYTGFEWERQYPPLAREREANIREQIAIAAREESMAEVPATIRRMQQVADNMYYDTEQDIFRALGICAFVDGILTRMRANLDDVSDIRRVSTNLADNLPGEILETMAQEVVDEAEPMQPLETRFRDLRESYQELQALCAAFRTALTEHANRSVVDPPVNFQTLHDSMVLAIRMVDEELTRLPSTSVRGHIQELERGLDLFFRTMIRAGGVRGDLQTTSIWQRQTAYLIHRLFMVAHFDNDEPVLGPVVDDLAQLRSDLTDLLPLYDVDGNLIQQNGS